MTILSLPQRFGANSALRISLLYAAFAGAWIWLSDSALQQLFSDPAALSWLQSAKGSFFVLVTSLLLFQLVRSDVRKRGTLTARLQRKAERLADIMSVNPAVIYSLTADAQTKNVFVVDYVSPKVEKITGYSPAQWLATPGLWLARLHPEDRAKTVQAHQQLLETGMLQYEYRFLHADGSWRWIYDQLVLSRNASGRGSVVVGAWLDITDSKLAQEQLQLTAQVFESSQEGIVITDVDNCFLSVNRAFSEITGYSKEDVLGRNPNLLASGRHDKVFYQTMWRTVQSLGHWQGEVWNRRKNGVVYPQWLSISALRNAEGQITQHIGTLTDLSSRKDAEEKIRFLSNYDPLTLLPNRTLLHDRAQVALAAAHRAQTQVALMYVDLDRFKNINDSLGHAIGDQLLQELATRLSTHLHPDDTICRPGGDEFICLLPNTGYQGAAHVAQRTLAIIAEPFTIDGQRLSLTASIGIALFPDNGADLARLSQCADSALFRAKQNGRSNFQFFAQQMHERANEVLRIENDLRRALENKELLLYYQPQVDATTLKIVGVEALVRWQHPEWGLVLPGRFISVAEESGQIRDIGSWVLYSAVQQNAAWQAAGLPIVPVAINLSVVQFKDATLCDTVVEAMRVSGLAPAMVELELTESIAMDDSSFTIDMVARLHALGIALSIDDFGTGYSSLSYLKRFKIDKLKIDQSFIRDLHRDPDDEAIVTAIIGLAKGLGFRTIAEGVETQGQLDFLREHQCDEIQGYFYSKPVPANEFARLLAHQRDQAIGEASVRPVKSLQSTDTAHPCRS
jgi:diguanylate cyclase (GGDEF)-like protein/PAS domain S-box-containing protein